MIDEAYLLVKQFQIESGQPCAEKPTTLSSDRRNIRYKWIKDELDEFESAEHIYEQADAIIDLLYYALGALVEMGVKPDAIFEIVHTSNMKKLNSISLDLDGKVLKPEGWEHPTHQIKALLDS